MFKKFHFVCTIAVPAALAGALEPGSPVRITAPVSVEQVMTVALPEAADQPLAELEPASVPLPEVDQDKAAEPQPGRAADSATAVAEGRSRDGAESVALPASEKMPLGQSMSGVSPGAGNDSASGLKGIARTGGALAAVIGLILVLRVLFVKFSGAAGGLRAQLGAAGKAPSGVLFVLGRYPVSRGMSLVLLQLDQRVLLLSQTASGFHTLAEIGDPLEVASILQKVRDESGESLGAKFSGMLKQFEKDPGTLADMDSGAEDRPVRLRRPVEDDLPEPGLGRSQAIGFYEDKPVSAARTGEDELRSRINRMREFGS